MWISMWINFSDTHFSVNIQDTEISCQEYVYQTLITISSNSFKDANIFREMCLLFYPVKNTVLRLWDFSDQLQISTLFKHQTKKNHSTSTDLTIKKKGRKVCQIISDSKKIWEVCDLLGSRRKLVCQINDLLWIVLLSLFKGNEPWFWKVLSQSCQFLNSLKSHSGRISISFTYGVILMRCGAMSRPEEKKSAFCSHLYHGSAAWPWANHLSSLDSSSSIWKLGMILYF